ncbi:MAG: long-chain fatty acid--CoA ligase [Deltaproteobacteria bacterium]|nr:long-chain fatty acid--CoA ligase [Deltaproteobacteria bacterium]
MALETIPHRVLAQAKQRPTTPAYYAKDGGQWRATTWRQYADEIRSAARALITLGLPRGGKVAILGFNRPEWVIFDHAAMMAGGVAAGIYTTCSPDEVQYIVHHSEAVAVLVEDEGQWKKIAAKRAELPLLKWVVTMKGAPAINDPLVLSWDAFMAKAAATPETTLDERIDKIQQDELATLIYTSGTTGPPKGVMLSHRNLAWTAETLISTQGGEEGDRGLSYLPLSHIAEQMCTIHVPAMSGAAVYFAESIEKVPDNIKEVQPTVFFGVPRIWEKFHAGVSAKLAQATGAKKYLVAWTRMVCTDVSGRRARNEPIPPLLDAQYRLVKKLVLDKLKPALGLGAARFCVSGAAPIAKDVLEFFASLDIMVHEVYGQSEDCGPTTLNIPGRTKLGSVGPALPGVQVKIADDGEILVKGPNVFLGYFKEPEATAEALVDGWLRSGDLGEFDRSGFLSITGRKKEILITAGGKNIAPKNIEAALKESNLISEAVVIGDRRKFLSVLITLDDAIAAKLCGAHVAKPHESPLVHTVVQKQVDEVNKTLARVEQIKKFRLIDRKLGAEDEELTPTMKLKRKLVSQKYAELIESMYRE